MEVYFDGTLLPTQNHDGDSHNQITFLAPQSQGKDLEVYVAVPCIHESCKQRSNSLNFSTVGADLPCS